MFADTLLDLERSHLILLAIWAAASVLAGTGLKAALAARRESSPVLSKFGLTMAAWGGVELAAVALLWPTLALRDLAGATRLDRILWLETGLDLGIIAVGVTLVVAAWHFGRRLGAVGAGAGTIVQGAALLALHGRLVLYLYGKV
jgi:hypothetical protein